MDEKKIDDTDNMEAHEEQGASRAELERKQFARDVIDKDLYEEFTDEELIELVEEARIEALEKARVRRENKEKPKPPFPKWFFWLIALAMFLNVAALLPQTLSIPAIDFLITSAKLSTQADVKSYKESVVVIETDDGRGTGFVMDEAGLILTNYHVIEGFKGVTVGSQKHGLFHGDVIAEYPEIDLAVVDIDDEQLPALSLADSFELQADAEVYFIGNPLKFQWIANEGTIIDYTKVSSKDMPVVMMDAPVYRGNSGSPVINDDGEVVGVVYATMEHTTEGRVGLFVPIDYFYDVWEK